MFAMTAAGFSAPVLVLATALGYLIATLGMKGAATGLVGPGLALAFGGFALAFAAEVALMRLTKLSLVYIAILGVETVLVLAVAFGIGEGFTLRQGLGAGLVLAGLAIVAA
ncbi:5-aminolevulinate synthase [Thetidibacter halocola]|uniref:5-aminolevulinate synthase n=1 Tax=Thetidibacter halocola TaxID=2827239 RepID=A0A8J7W8B1_9RHOB|nr:5-aminolevulinate synthase [Thetidibacter halocola]MBS0122735.1 5-aminolevulinate synthase [Thetidibacter halocola]